MQCNTENEKRSRWKTAIRSRQASVTHDVVFVPFCVEVGGAWGSAANKFFNTCVELAGDDRDTDLYQLVVRALFCGVENHDFSPSSQR